MLLITLRCRPPDDSVSPRDGSGFKISTFGRSPCHADDLHEPARMQRQAEGGRLSARYPQAIGRHPLRPFDSI